MPRRTTVDLLTCPNGALRLAIKWPVAWAHSAAFMCDNKTGTGCGLGHWDGNTFQDGDATGTVGEVTNVFGVKKEGRK
jgi:hypothetical protein